MRDLNCPASFHKSPSIQRVAGQLYPLLNFLQKFFQHTRNAALTQNASLPVYQGLESGRRCRTVFS